MAGDPLIGASPEPLASCDAAFSCLLQLGGQSGGSEVGGVNGRNVVNGETLSISRLIELAGDLGIKAEPARLDWQRLQTPEFGYPALALLKNTNVVVLTGRGRDGSAEVAVWDPLNRCEEILFVSRENFQRVWTGHLLIITAAKSNRAVMSACSDPGRAAPPTERGAAHVEPALPSPAAAPGAPYVEPAPPGSATAAGAPHTKSVAPAASTNGSRLSAEEMAALLARGDKLLSVGDVASARLFYERAAGAGGGLAATRLGETFDPLFLDRIHLSGVRGDPTAASFWYHRAHDLGATDAEVLLKALETESK